MDNDRIAALEARVELLEAAAHFPKYMTADQVCDAMQINRTKFWQLRSEGLAPPALFLGTRTMRFDRDDVLQWAAALKETV